MLNNGSGVKINSEKTERQMVEEYISGVKSSVLMKKYGYKTKKSITDKVRKYKGKETALERNIQIFKILSYDRPFGMMRKYLNLYQ